MQRFRPNATPDGASTTGAECLSHFRWKVVQRSNYPVHAALPTKRYARRCIYNPRRMPYSFPLEGSLEVELSCPRSAEYTTWWGVYYSGNTRLSAINSVLDAWHLAPQGCFRRNTIQ